MREPAKGAASSRRPLLRAVLLLAAILAAAYAAAGAAVLYSRPAGAHGRFTLSASASAVSKAQAARRVVAFLAAENYVQAYALYSGRILGDAQAVSVFRAALDAYLDELLVEYRAGAAPQKKVDATLALLEGYVLDGDSFAGASRRFTDPSYTPAEPDTPVTLGMIGVSILPQQSNFSAPDLRLVPFGYADPPPNLAADRAVFPEIAVNRFPTTRCSSASTWAARRLPRTGWTRLYLQRIIRSSGFQYPGMKSRRRNGTEACTAGFSSSTR